MESPKMDRTFYVCQYRFDGREGCLIWYTNEPDGVLTGSDGKVLRFSDAQSLREYAASIGIVIEPETPILHDLDVAAKWVAAGGQGNVNPDELLKTWNLFTDVAYSVGASFEGESPLLEDIYSRLVQSSDLPALIVPGSKPCSEWEEEERKILSDVLSRGLTVFRNWTNETSHQG